MYKRETDGDRTVDGMVVLVCACRGRTRALVAVTSDRGEGAHMPRDGSHAATHVDRQLAPRHDRPAPRYRTCHRLPRARQRCVRVQLVPCYQRAASPRTRHRATRTCLALVSLRKGVSWWSCRANWSMASRERVCMGSRKGDLHFAALDALTAEAARHLRERAPCRVICAMRQRWACVRFARKSHCHVLRRLFHPYRRPGGFISRE